MPCLRKLHPLEVHFDAKQVIRHAALGKIRRKSYLCRFFLVLELV